MQRLSVSKRTWIIYCHNNSLEQARHSGWASKTTAASGGDEARKKENEAQRRSFSVVAHVYCRRQCPVLLGRKRWILGIEGGQVPGSAVLRGQGTMPGAEVIFTAGSRVAKKPLEQAEPGSPGQMKYMAVLAQVGRETLSRLSSSNAEPFTPLLTPTDSPTAEISPPGD